MSLTTFYLVHKVLFEYTLVNFGGEFLKKFYEEKIKKKKKIGAFGLTELEYGSDASSL